MNVTHPMEEERSQETNTVCTDRTTTTPIPTPTPTEEENRAMEIPKDIRLKNVLTLAGLWRCLRGYDEDTRVHAHFRSTHHSKTNILRPPMVLKDHPFNILLLTRESVQTVKELMEELQPYGESDEVIIAMTDSNGNHYLVQKPQMGVFFCEKEGFYTETFLNKFRVNSSITYIVENAEGYSADQFMVTLEKNVPAAALQGNDFWRVGFHWYNDDILDKTYPTLRKHCNWRKLFVLCGKATSPCLLYDCVIREEDMNRLFGCSDAFIEDLILKKGITAEDKKPTHLEVQQFLDIGTKAENTDEDKKAIQRFLSQKNPYPFEDNWPIIHAVSLGDDHILSLLLREGRYDPSAQNNMAILEAIRKGYFTIVRQLLRDKRVDPSARCNQAIQSASTLGYLEIVRDLLKDERTDPSAKENGAILGASTCGHLEVVRELLKDKRVDPSASRNAAIRYASDNCHVETVGELLKDERVDPSEYNNAIIRNASINGHLRLVKELLKGKRVDPSALHNQSIRWASNNGHWETVKELLKDERVDPTACDNEAIRNASTNGHLEVVRELLRDERVDPSADNNGAIRFASKSGHFKVVNELLKDKRMKISPGIFSVLKSAIRNEQYEVADIIIQRMEC